MVRSKVSRGPGGPTAFRYIIAASLAALLLGVHGLYLPWHEASEHHEGHGGELHRHCDLDAGSGAFAPRSAALLPLGTHDHGDDHFHRHPDTAFGSALKKLVLVADVPRVVPRLVAPPDTRVTPAAAAPAAPRSPHGTSPPNLRGPPPSRVL